MAEFLQSSTSDFDGREPSSVQVSPRADLHRSSFSGSSDFSWLPTPTRSANSRQGFDVEHEVIRLESRKRILDLAIGLPLALALTPLMIVMALGSTLAYRAWPLFKQERLSKNGATFQVVKIRSLPTHTPTTIAKTHLNGAENNHWGRTIRKFHLDEIPQLWHVVSGTMSLVGPRPEMLSLCATFDQAFVQQRSQVAPGCTGLWQISSASNGLIGDDTSFDLHYITHRTIRLDLWILMRTASVMLGRNTIRNLHEIPAWTGAKH